MCAGQGLVTGSRTPIYVSLVLMSLGTRSFRTMSGIEIWRCVTCRARHRSSLDLCCFAINQGQRVRRPTQLMFMCHAEATGRHEGSWIWRSILKETARLDTQLRKGRRAVGPLRIDDKFGRSLTSRLKDFLRLIKKPS